ncbi:hypothetical protein C8R46DRAFT_1025376 [Mycena filopes]|nr:hypothetical protein C8R46DRAFT_1025376 [Mycena filopes]
MDLMATWFTILLCGVAFTQAFHYFARFPDDGLIRKSLVGVVIFLLLLTQAVECAETYARLVTEWGNPAALGVQPVLFLLSGALIALIVDQFLIHRFYSISKNMWIAVVLTVLNLASLVMGLLVLQILASTVGGGFTLETIEKIGPISIAWGSISAATDVSIAACLVWKLRGMRTSFKDTTQLIHHIMAVSIQNGCTTSVLSIAGVVASVVAPSSKIEDIFFMFIGPLYLITLLSSLSLRGTAKANRTFSSGADVSGSSQIAFGGVHVRRSVATTGGTTTLTDSEGARKEYDDTTVRGKSDDIEAQKEGIYPAHTSCQRDRSSWYQNA